MTHILIFHPQTFDYLGFLNSEKTKIISPKALAMAKKHFNCENLDGIPLENGGGSGTIKVIGKEAICMEILWWALILMMLN